MSFTEYTATLSRYCLALSAGALILLIAGSVYTGDSSSGSHEWQSPHGTGHILTGKIWKTSTGTMLSRSQLLDELVEAEFILLGETHDNPDHHILQANLVDGLVAVGASPGVVMELFDSDQQSAIDRVLESSSPAADAVIAATRARQDGWPVSLYKPVISSLLSNALPIYGGDVPDAVLQVLRDSGLEKLGAERIERLSLQMQLPSADIEIFRNKIIESHCGYAIGDHVNKMLDLQRVRDAWLADVMLSRSKQSTVILMAGKGHVRKDYAVPAYLRSRRPAADYTVIAMLEVSEDKKHPSDYMPETAFERPVYDYVWFTSAVRNEDPCEQFRQQLQRIVKPADSPGVNKP